MTYSDDFTIIRLIQNNEAEFNIWFMTTMGRSLGLGLSPLQINLYRPLEVPEKNPCGPRRRERVFMGRGEKSLWPYIKFMVNKNYKNYDESYIGIDYLTQLTPTARFKEMQLFNIC
jgi:hypothetical protein